MFLDDLCDMLNSFSVDEFWSYYDFLIGECFRVIKFGWFVLIYCMQLLMLKMCDGFIGLWDFCGEIIVVYQKYGFIYYFEVCICKDLVQLMQ